MGGWMGDIQILLNFLQLIVFYGFLVVIVWMLRKLTKDIGNIKQSITDLQELILQMGPGTSNVPHGIPSPKGDRE